MAPMSRGQSSKPVKTKSAKQKKDGTTNRHRFQSFSEKIANLKIEPIRRVKHHEIVETTSSHFRSSFEEWQGLNLSSNFTLFAQQASPLCNSLPQLLHNQSQIVDLLVAFIEKHDTHSLEPLLRLIPKLAQDLGSRFEKYFERIVRVVSNLAASHQDIEIIQWSFDCLAWLFKYLSRLLVPDLRSLYDLMVPLLGKERQKPFITRFAAEAMSFLLRKAGATHQRNPDSLVLIINHILSDLENAPRDRLAQLQHGVSVLLSESMKGLQRSLHTSAVPIFNAILDRLFDPHAEAFAGHEASETVVEASLINLLHHSDGARIKPVVDAMLQKFDCTNLDWTDPKLRLAFRLVFVSVAVRKGTRIQDWEFLRRWLQDCLDYVEQNPITMSSVAQSGFLKIIAGYLQYCPLETLLQNDQQALVTKTSKNTWRDQFLLFCDFVGAIGKDRFDSFVRQDMERFIINNWKAKLNEIVFLLPKLMTAKEIQSCSKIVSLLDEQLSEDLQQISQLQRNPHSLDSSAVLVYRSNQLLSVFNSMTTERGIPANLPVRIRDVLQTSLKDPSKSSHDHIDMLAMHNILFATTLHNIGRDLNERAWSSICETFKHYCCNEIFLDAVLRLMQQYPEFIRISSHHTGILVDNLIHLATAKSPELRLRALQIFSAMYTGLGSQSPEALGLALRLEESSFTLEFARVASTTIKRIGFLHSTASNDTWLQRLLPAYCFGLLHVKLASIWSDACDALVVMGNNKDTEEFIITQALSWIEGAGASIESQKFVADEKSQILTSTEFNCTNLDQLDRSYHERKNHTDTISVQLERNFCSTTEQLYIESSTDRSQALLVLKKNSQLAEKKSRFLVPLFLNWRQEDLVRTLEDIELGSEDETLTSQEISQIKEGHQWSRQDQMAFLDIFAQFVNPKMLYKSDEVRDIILEMLCNGDAGIQKAALKALLAWKDTFIAPYRENLLNLLDEARLRDELTIFINFGSEESTINEEHRTDLVPILFRLLYGRMVARGGSSTSRGTQASKRKSILTVLSRFPAEELDEFMKIALGPLNHLVIDPEDFSATTFFQKANISSRRQYGLLNSLQDMLVTIPNMLSPFISRLLSSVLFCHGLSCRKLDSIPNEDEPLIPKESEVGLLKSIRQATLKCLQLLFSNYPDFTWSSYSSILFSEAVNPRLEKLPSETAQSVSIVLQIFATWSNSESLRSLLWSQNPHLLENIADCLATNNVREEVQFFTIVKILKPVLELAKLEAENNEDKQDVKDLKHLLIGPTGSHILGRIRSVVQSSPSKPLLEGSVECLLGLGQFLKQSGDAYALFELSLDLLKLPSNTASPRLKSRLLQLTCEILPLVDIDCNTSIFTECLQTISSLFSFFVDAQNRQKLVTTLKLLTNGQPKFVQIVDVCEGLNAWSSSRLDDPDYDRRLQSFHSINDNLHQSMDSQQWMPVTHNALFFIKDEVDLATRRSASLCLRRIVQNAQVKPDLVHLIENNVLPAIHNGIRDGKELVSMEYMTVLADIVLSNHTSMQDMRCLLGSDEESSFFNNIYHLQQHRRARALRRLAAETSRISSHNLARFCLPLVEHHMKSKDTASLNTAAEAVNTIEFVSAGLEWQRYRALLHKMVTGVSKLDERLPVRSLGAVVNAMYRSSKPASDQLGAKHKVETSAAYPNCLADTLPDQNKLLEVLSKSVLPTLADHLHFKDESTVELRILVAPIAVKICLVFPPDTVSTQLSGILMDTCNVLKSRAQEARDSARKALIEITELVGPSYFGFILKQLRSSLQRGYQIHVLCYTVHQLLTHVASKFELGSLDYCASDIMEVIVNETFGHIAQEKEARDYTSSMKEVKKKNLGYDSMETLATMVTMPCVGRLLKPIQNQLEQPKARTEKVEELLRRLREGLRRNQNANDRQILTLCYEILRDVRREAQSKPSTATMAYNQLSGFANDLLRRTLDKHEDLKTPENLSAFMPGLQNSLDEGDDQVQTAALRCLTSIIKVPLPEIDQNSGNYLRKARSIIESSSSTNTTLAQAALRLASAVLRERPQAVIKQSQFEAHVAYLLDRIKPDLQEPSRQGERDRQVAAFNFIRAVLSRGVLMKEIYEIMDVVRQVMVTSNESPIPDLSRSVYSKFLVDYFPNKGKGLSKQVDYLISNLQYPNARGKKSVMEVILFLVTKVDEVSVQNLLVNFFLPLVLVIGTDESDDCRENARSLLHKILERADAERQNIFTSQLLSWIARDADHTWKTIGFRCWHVYFSLHKDAESQAQTVIHSAQLAIRVSSEHARNIDDTLLCAALDILKTLAILFPALVFDMDSKYTWVAITSQAHRMSAETKLSYLGLLSILLGYFAKSAAENDMQLGLPMTGSSGLRFEEDDAMALTEMHLKLLMERLSTELSTVLIKNVTFLARVCASNSNSIVQRIISELSTVLRGAENEFSIHAKAVALDTISAMCKSLPDNFIQENVHIILVPLQSATDENIPLAWSADPEQSILHEQMKTTGQEALDALQEKVGSTAFLTEMQDISKQVKERRDERRAKRRIEVVAAPEKAMYKKQKKHEAGKLRRKEKNAKAAGKRRGW